MRLLLGRGPRQSAFLLFIWQKKLIGTDTKADSTSGCFAMPRPLLVVPPFAKVQQRGLAKTNPGRSQRALFRASCVTRCAVTARPFAFVPDKRVRLLQGKGSRQSAFLLFIWQKKLIGTDTKADSTSGCLLCRASSLWFNLRDILSAGARKDGLSVSCL